MDWYTLSELVWKGLVGGAISFIARKALEQGQKELEELQGIPPELTDRDREELLAHYVESITEEFGEAEDLSVRESVAIIRSRAGVFAAYVYLKVQRLSSEGENPKGV